MTAPDWYGFPDICGDGLPVNHEKHFPLKGKVAELFLENPPEWACPAAFLEELHSYMCKMDFHAPMLSGSEENYLYVSGAHWHL